MAHEARAHFRSRRYVADDKRKSYKRDTRTVGCGANRYGLVAERPAIARGRGKWK